MRCWGLREGLDHYESGNLIARSLNSVVKQVPRRRPRSADRSPGTGPPLSGNHCRLSLLRERLDVCDTAHEAAKDVGTCDNAFLLCPNEDHIFVDDIVSWTFGLDFQETDDLA